MYWKTKKGSIQINEMSRDHVLKTIPLLKKRIMDGKSMIKNLRQQLDKELDKLFLNEAMISEMLVRLNNNVISIDEIKKGQQILLKDGDEVSYAEVVDTEKAKQRIREYDCEIILLKDV